MTAALPQVDASPAALPRRRSRIPGVNALRATSGFQRGMLVGGLAIVGLFVVLAVFAPLIAPYGFAQTSDHGHQLPNLAPPSAHHWFGTMKGQYDVLSRTIWGAQTALEVILLAVALSIVVGVPVGLISGFFGGWLDRVLVLIADALYSFPSLLLAIVISVSISGGSSGKLSGILASAVSITVVYVPQYFRVVRNATIAAREEPFVEAARALGAPPGVQMRRYVFTNVVQTVPVIATLNAGDAILTLAGLGFLGIGIEPTAAAEWGHDLNNARDAVSAGLWWPGLFPGLAIVLLVLGVTLVGESLNDVLNPLLRTTKLRNVVLPRRPPQSPVYDVLPSHVAPAGAQSAESEG